MTELDGLIQYWKAMLETRFFLSLVVIAHIKNTIKYLEQLRSKENAGRKGMIKAIELAKFAEKNGWVVIEKVEEKDTNFIRYLTPSGRRVLVEFNEDGSIWRVYP